MKKKGKHLNKYRYAHPYLGESDEDALWGTFKIPHQDCVLHVISSGERHGVVGPAAWEHVSVSIAGEERCPTWEEMCFVKELFWRNDETVIQFHPKKSDYVNFHKHCLHLWKSPQVEIELPPIFAV